MSRKLTNLLAAATILGFLVFFTVLGPFQAVLDRGRLLGEALSSPFAKVFTPVRNFYQTVFYLRDISLQNRILTEQVEKLSAELAVLEKTKGENEILRQALGFGASRERDLVPAEIIARDVSKPDQTLIINRGKRDGVSDENAVLSPGGSLVGMVTKAFEQTSEVELLTSPRVTVSVEILPGRGSGIVRGEHGLGLLLDLVSQTDNIQSGDRVVTSGLSGQFPKNLFIGHIGTVRSTESELFKKADVIPVASLKDLQIIMVAKKGQ